jgi:hypothetical protein
MNAVVSVRHCRTTFCSPVLAILQDPSSVSRSCGCVGPRRLRGSNPDQQGVAVTCSERTHGPRAVGPKDPASPHTDRGNIRRQSSLDIRAYLFCSSLFRTSIPYSTQLMFCAICSPPIHLSASMQGVMRGGPDGYSRSSSPASSVQSGGT